VSTICTRHATRTQNDGCGAPSKTYVPTTAPLCHTPSPAADVYLTAPQGGWSHTQLCQLGSNDVNRAQESHGPDARRFQACHMHATIPRAQPWRCCNSSSSPQSQLSTCTMAPLWISHLLCTQRLCTAVHRRNTVTVQHCPSHRPQARSYNASSAQLRAARAGGR
jgi:hypothetical protein